MANTLSLNWEKKRDKLILPSFAFPSLKTPLLYQIRRRRGTKRRPNIPLSPQVLLTEFGPVSVDPRTLRGPTNDTIAPGLIQCSILIADGLFADALFPKTRSGQ